MSPVDKMELVLFFNDGQTGRIEGVCSRLLTREEKTHMPDNVRIPKAKEMFGIGKSTIYEIAREHDGVLKKLNNITFVNVPKMESIFANLPDAELGKQRKQPAKK
jgi:hypothetical protein